MTRKILFLFLCCLVFVLVGCGTDASAQPSNGSSAQSLGNTNILVNSSTTTIASGATDTPITNSQPTTTPTIQPTPTTKPTAIPTATPQPPAHPCSVSSCPNPWGYFLQVGVNNANGTVVTSPPSGFCSYFTCATSFSTNIAGHVIECSDQQFAWSGNGCNVSGDGYTIGNLMKPYGNTPTPTA